MRSGRLRHSITITEKTPGQNEYGAELDTFDNVTETRANVQVLSGSEAARQGIVINSESISVLMRQNSNITYDRYINWNNFNYRIVTIRPSDDDRQIVVTAQREL